MKIGTLVRMTEYSHHIGIVIARKGSTEWLVSFPKSGKQHLINQRYLIRID